MASKTQLQAVLDTSVLHGNWHLEGPNYTLLHTHVEKGLLRVQVPEVVVLEFVELYARELAKHSSSLRQLGTLLRGTVLPSIDQRQVVKQYESFLRKRLRDLGFKILKHPKTSHGLLVRRALARRKPFSKSGSGYRDALIWELTRRSIRQNKATTVLLTRNTKDFSDPNNAARAHPDLLADLSPDFPYDSRFRELDSARRV